MNERIKLLAEQAGATVMERSGWTDYGTLNLEVEKFAELIVAECIDVLENRHETFKGSRDHYGSGFKSGLDAATRTVKEHFGVDIK